MTQIIILHSLLGDYSHVADEIEREINTRSSEAEKKEDKFGKVDPIFLEKLNIKDLHNLCFDLVKSNSEVKEENALLKEELNELYSQYDAMAASFGEINHLLKEAASVPDKHFKTPSE